jgi:hypothetical protein
MNVSLQCQMSADRDSVADPGGKEGHSTEANLANAKNKNR